MKNPLSKAFCVWIALLALLAALGAWVMADGARQFRQRPVIEEFARGRAREWLE